jgi:molybdopterin-guanine dinucleotide biosynthesis protein A
MYNLTGVILSGGKSSRMKQDKGLMEIEGKLMIHYCYNSMSEICNEIIVSANSDKYLNLGYNIVTDIIPDCGPIGGLYTALKNCNTEYMLIQPVDMPFLPNRIYKTLLSKIGENMMVVPEYKGNIEPLVMIIKRDAIVSVKKEIDNRNYKMRDLVDKYGEVVNIDNLNIVTGTDFRNLNRPEDINNL